MSATLKEVNEICVKYRGRDKQLENKLIAGTLLPLTLTWLCVVTAPTLFLSIPASVLSGLLYIRMFHFHHEHCHGAFLDKDSFYGRLLRFMAKTLMVTDSELWERGHNKHHKEVGQYGVLLGGAVGIVTLDQYAGLDVKTRRVYNVARHPVFLFVASYLTIFVGYFNLFPILTGSRHTKRALIALSHHIAFLVVTALAVGVPKMILLGIVPIAIGAAIGTGIFYLQHLFEGAEYGEDSDPLLDRVNNTTSRFRAPRLVLWFLGDQENHHIHHIDPKVPFYRHCEAYDAEPELRNCPDLSLNIHTIRRCMDCFVWDVGRSGFVSKSYASKHMKLVTEGNQ